MYDRFTTHVDEVRNIGTINESKKFSLIFSCMFKNHKYDGKAKTSNISDNYHIYNYRIFVQILMVH
jgi:hypothetical protein